MENREVSNFVKMFLRTMEARDLESAEAMMAPGARITFPGGKEFTSQREMVESSRGRYRWVKKIFSQQDVQEGEDAFVVYVMGTLYGVNKYGIEFSGVRFIDRFVIKDSLIKQQDVWNDLAESGVLEMKN